MASNQPLLTVLPKLVMALLVICCLVLSISGNFIICHSNCPFVQLINILYCVICIKDCHHKLECTMKVSTCCYKSLEVDINIVYLNT